MTAALHHVLRCDEDGCGTCYTAGERRADHTRQIAAADHGWVHGVVLPDPCRGGLARSLDYCPEHAARLGDLRPKPLPQHARPVSPTE